MTDVFRYCRLHGGYYGTSCPEYHGTGGVTGRVAIPLSEGEMHVTLDHASKRTIEALKAVGEAAANSMEREES